MEHVYIVSVSKDGTRSLEQQSDTNFGLLILELVVTTCGRQKANTNVAGWGGVELIKKIGSKQPESERLRSEVTVTRKAKSSIVAGQR